MCVRRESLLRPLLIHRDRSFDIRAVRLRSRAAHADSQALVIYAHPQNAVIPSHVGLSLVSNASGLQSYAESLLTIVYIKWQRLRLRLHSTTGAQSLLQRR